MIKNTLHKVYLHNKKIDMLSEDDRFFIVIILGGIFFIVLFCLLMYGIISNTVAVINYMFYFTMMFPVVFGAILLIYRLPYKLGCLDFLSQHQEKSFSKIEKKEKKKWFLFFSSLFRKIKEKEKTKDKQNQDKKQQKNNFQYQFEKEMKPIDMTRLLNLAILKLPRNADEQDIKKAYRKLCMLYHPDRNIGKNTEERFKRIKKAYEELMPKNYD